MSKHDTMADNSTDLKNDSTDTDRWKHTGTGSGQARDELFGALFDERPSKAQVYPVKDGEVHLGVVVGQDDADGPSIDTDIYLAPGAAEALARDLMEVATAARQQQSDE
jgi:hypothetical protein